MNNKFTIFTAEQKEEFDKLCEQVRDDALPHDKDTHIRLKFLTSVSEVEHRVNTLLRACELACGESDPIAQFNISTSVELQEVLTWTDIEKVKKHIIRCACALQFLVSMLANGKCAFIAEDIEHNS